MAILFDEQGCLMDRESLEHHQFYPRPGWVEHDGSEILTNTRAALKSLLSRHTDQLGDIKSLSISNQRETIISFDRKSGKPLAPAIVWQCRRGTEICERHEKAGWADKISQRTGLRLDPYFSASKLQWLVENNSYIASKLKDGNAVAATIDSFLIHHFTQGEVLATDHTNACRTLLYNLDRLDWDPELCDLLKIPPAALPEIRDSSGTFGETDLDGLLPNPVPIRGVMGDSHAALLAQRCFAPGSAKVTFGTGSSILMTLGPERRNSTKGVVTTLAWVHKGKPTFAFEGIIISSASTLVWLRDQLGILPEISKSAAIANSLKDNGGVYLVPAFTGLGLPHWQPEARAAIVGLSTQSDQRHIIRAAEESIAYQLRDALEAMRADAQTELRSIHADGGPTRDNFLMQFTADMTGVDLHVSGTPECSPLGAVLSGMWGSGFLDSPDAISALPRKDYILRPSMKTEEVTQLHNGWLAAVRKTLS